MHDLLIAVDWICLKSDKSTQFLLSNVISSCRVAIYSCEYNCIHIIHIYIYLFVCLFIYSFIHLCIYFFFMQRSVWAGKGSFSGYPLRTKELLSAKLPVLLPAFWVFMPKVGQIPAWGLILWMKSFRWCVGWLTFSHWNFPLRPWAFLHHQRMGDLTFVGPLVHHSIHTSFWKVSCN